MKRLYIAGGVIAVMAFLAVGLFFAKGPQPEITVKAEHLWTVGPLTITNTLLTSWVVLVGLIVIAWLCTRSLQLIPSGPQNFIEGVISFLLAQIEEIAGEKNGRRFFMVIATIFIWIIANNWFGLMPFFNAIGKTEDVNHAMFEKISDQAEKDKPFDERLKQAGWFMDNSSGVTYTKSGAKQVEFECEIGDTAAVCTDKYIVTLAKEFAGFKMEAAEGAAPTAEEVQAAVDALKADPKAPKVHLAEGEGGGHAIPSAALGQSVEGIDFPGKKLGLVVPFFRGTFSDVNNTLAMGIIAFIMIEFWGFQALGAGYLKKFFNLNGIMSFVGILEFLSEIIRVISFCFRLFGNIFAGEVLVLMLTFLMPFLFVDVIYGLELFVGFIQAAVFALLTLVFAVGAVEHHGEDEHHDGHEGGDADAHHTEPHVAGAVQAH